MFDLSAKALFGYEPDKSGEDMGKNLTNFVDGVMSVPLNVPGTTFHRCMQVIREAFTNLSMHLFYTSLILQYWYLLNFYPLNYLASATYGQDSYRMWPGSLHHPTLNLHLTSYFLGIFLGAYRF